VQREVARIEAMEADQRERVMHNRLLRAHRDALERERELDAYLEMEARENARLTRLREVSSPPPPPRDAVVPPRLPDAAAPRHDPEGLAGELARSPAPMPAPPEPPARPAAAPPASLPFAPAPPPRPRAAAPRQNPDIPAARPAEPAAPLPRAAAPARPTIFLPRGTSPPVGGGNADIR
jgi:hypothetical protein